MEKAGRFRYMATRDLKPSPGLILVHQHSPDPTIKL